MAELRAKRLWYGVTTSTTYVDLFTVPANRRYIIKRLTGRNNSGTGGSLQLYVKSVHSLPTIPVAANGSLNYEMWYVINAGDTLQAAVGPGMNLSWSISGSDHFVNP